MKKQILPLLLVLLTFAALAQQEAADQNPRYQESRDRYMGLKDSLIAHQGTTVQQTYQAYDWMAIRQERKDIRFLNRQQRRLNRSLNNSWYYPNDYYFQPSYNTGFYGSGFYNNSYRNRYGRGNYYHNRYWPGFLWWFLL